jgi:hypothetical protein
MNVQRGAKINRKRKEKNRLIEGEGGECIKGTSDQFMFPLVTSSLVEKGRISWLRGGVLI